MRVVLWWSFFTAATGWAWNFVVARRDARFLFGAGEAGCFPNLTKASSRSGCRRRARAGPGHHVDERALGRRLHAAARRLRPEFVALAAARSRSSACSGVVWAIVFYRWFRDNPRDHPAVNAAELRAARRRATTSPSATPTSPGDGSSRSRRSGCSGLQYFCLSYGWYFYITWLPTYLQEARGTSDARSARCSPACRSSSAASAASSAGSLSARVARRDRAASPAARRVMAVVGFAGARRC